MKKVKISSLIGFHAIVLSAAALLAICGCPIYTFLKIPCPLCGTTRAWVSFFTGDIPTAFRYHALFPITPFWFFAAVHYSSIFKQSKPVGIFLICIALALAVYNLFRIFGLTAWPG